VILQRTYKIGQTQILPYPVDIYRLWLSRSGRFGLGRRYLQKGLRSSSQRNLSKSQIWWL